MAVISTSARIMWLSYIIPSTVTLMMFMECALSIYLTGATLTLSKFTVCWLCSIIECALTDKSRTGL